LMSKRRGARVVSFDDGSLDEEAVPVITKTPPPTSPTSLEMSVSEAAELTSDQQQQKKVASIMNKLQKITGRKMSLEEIGPLLFANNPDEAMRNGRLIHSDHLKRMYGGRPDYLIVPGAKDGGEDQDGDNQASVVSATSPSTAVAVEGALTPASSSEPLATNSLDSSSPNNPPPQMLNDPGTTHRVRSEAELSTDSAESREMPGSKISSRQAQPPMTPTDSTVGASVEILPKPQKEPEEEAPRHVPRRRSRSRDDPARSSAPINIQTGSKKRKSRSFFDQSLHRRYESMTDEVPSMQAEKSVALGRKIDKLSKLTGRRDSLSEIRPLLESKTVEQARSNAQSLYQVEKLKKRYGDRPIVESGSDGSDVEPHSPTEEVKAQGSHPERAPAVAASPLRQQQSVPSTSHKHRKTRDHDRDKEKNKEGKDKETKEKK